MHKLVPSLLALAVLSSCATPPSPVALPPSKDEVTLTGKDQRALVALKPNGRVTVLLQANEAAGYKWHLERPLDPKVLALDSSSAELPPVALAPDTGPVSAPTVSKQFIFKAVGPGTTKVRLMYSRPHESLDSEAFFEFTVIAE